MYIDQPVRTYSSGMKARLGFAFAVSSDPEVLVVDEALSVGDKKFQEKCFARCARSWEDENVTVLFVTHSSSAAEEFLHARHCARSRHEKVRWPPSRRPSPYYENNY